MAQKVQTLYAPLPAMTWYTVSASATDYTARWATMTSTGGEGRDWIFGGHDNDYIVGDNGEDQPSGGDGNDVIVASDDKLADEVACGPGEDIAYLSGPDDSSLAHDCEHIETFKSFEKTTNSEGRC